MGIRNFIVGGRRANDIEKIVKNLVYQQMVRLGYEVKVGQLYSISMTPYMDSSKWEGIIHIPFVDFLKDGFVK